MVIGYDFYIGDWSKKDDTVTDASIVRSIDRSDKRTEWIRVKGFKSDTLRAKAHRLRKFDAIYVRDAEKKYIRSFSFILESFAKYFALSKRDKEKILYDYMRLMKKSGIYRYYDKEIIVLAFIAYYMKKYKRQYLNKRVLDEAVGRRGVHHEVMTVLRRIEKLLDDKPTILSYKEVWQNIVSRFNLSYKEAKLGEWLLGLLEKENISRSRMVMAGGVLYIVKKCVGEPITQDKVSKAIGVTEVSVRSAVKLLMRLVGARTIDDLCKKLKEVEKKL